MAAVQNSLLKSRNLQTLSRILRQ